jgi:hypothetical protein
MTKTTEIVVEMNCRRNILVYFIYILTTLVFFIESPFLKQYLFDPYEHLRKITDICYHLPLGFSNDR